MSYLSIFNPLCRFISALQKNQPTAPGHRAISAALILYLVCISPSVYAEHTDKKNQVYNAHSQLTVDKINKAVEVLRNPTVMSGNFRQALQNLSPRVPEAFAATTSPDIDDQKDMPFISLIGKVISKDKPSSVVLRINDHSVHMTEGGTSSQLVNRKIVNIRVDKVTEDAVTIFLSPFKQTMVLK